MDDAMEYLVSMMIPCYNGAKTIPRLFDSILGQTYKNIEVVFVNDGSIDNTEDIVMSYKDKFALSGISFQYIAKHQGGLGSAIDAALKQFTGDFLTWVDSDDFLDKASIEKRLNYLLNHPEYAIVSSDAYVFHEDDLQTPIGTLGSSYKKFNHDEKQFMHLINEDSLFCCGCHMVRTLAFLDVNPNKEIYKARRGQNWQMLLPIYYKYKRGFLDEPLYNYIVYKKSMSKDDINNFNLRLERIEEHENIICQTINKINMEDAEKEYYLRYVKDRYIKKKMIMAFELNEKHIFNENYRILAKNKKIRWKERLYCWIINNSILTTIYKTWVKVRKEMSNNL